MYANSRVLPQRDPLQLAELGRRQPAISAVEPSRNVGLPFTHSCRGKSTTDQLRVHHACSRPGAISDNPSDDRACPPAAFSPTSQNACRQERSGGDRVEQPPGGARVENATQGRIASRREVDSNSPGERDVALREPSRDV